MSRSQTGAAPAAYLDGPTRAFALMAAVGETYFPAFALAAGLGSIASGLVVTLPLLLGAVLQLFIPRFLPRVGSHRKWVLFFTALQGLRFCPGLLGW